jgi:hypothetical protein
MVCARQFISNFYNNEPFELNLSATRLGAIAENSLSTELHVPYLIILTTSPGHISIATCIQNIAHVFMQVTQTYNNNESSLI